MAAQLDYAKVLDKSIKRLLEDLDPDPILHYFIQESYLLPTTIRDIQEARTTTAKNRAIIEKVKNKGLGGYRKFKKFLRATWQEHLAEYLEEMEKKVQPGQKQRTDGASRGAEQVTNYGAPGALNSFRGTVNNEGTMNFSGAGDRDGASRGAEQVTNYGAPGALNSFRGTVNNEGTMNFSGAGDRDGASRGAEQVTNYGAPGALNSFRGTVNNEGTMNFSGAGDRGPPQPAFNPSLYHPSGYPPPYSYSYQGQPAPNQIQPASNQMQPASNQIQPAPNQMQPAPNQIQPAPNQIQPASNQMQPAPNQIQPASDQGQPAHNLINLNQPDAIRNLPNQPTGEPALPKTQSAGNFPNEGGNLREKEIPKPESSATPKGDNAPNLYSQDTQSGLPPIQETVKKTTRIDVFDGRTLDVRVDWLEEKVIKNGEKLLDGNIGNVYRSNEDVPEWGIKVVVKKDPKKDPSGATQSVPENVRVVHHGIVPLLARGASHDNMYWVYPFMGMEKGDLMNAIKNDMNNLNTGRKADMRAKERVTNLYQVASTLQLIHKKEAFYGSITTKNIVLDIKNNARILNFGGVKKYSEDSTDWKKDIRAFGYVILEMLTGADLENLQSLDETDLDNLSVFYNDCYKGVWESEEKSYDKLLKLSKVCLKEKNDFETITTVLHDILLESFGGPWQKMNEAYNQDKCSMCILNDAVKDFHNLDLDLGCELSKSHVALPVCVACMRNSYLHPIKCVACRATINTKIGSTWGALLIQGYDDDEEVREVFESDVQDVKKTLISKDPLVFGLSEGNVVCTDLDDLEEAIEEWKKEKSLLTKVFIYYTGHNHKELGFLGNKKNLPNDEFKKLLEGITKDLVLVLDCCCAFNWTKVSSPSNEPKIKLQLNASRPTQEATYRKDGSMFTQFFIQSLNKVKSTTKVCGKDCHICKGYVPESGKRGFISADALFENIYIHMHQESKRSLWNVYPRLYKSVENIMDLYIAYYIDRKTKIKFRCEDLDVGHYEDEDMEEMKEMSDLKLKLLKHILEKKYDKDTDPGQWDLYWESTKTTWHQYSDVITIRNTAKSSGKDTKELSEIKDVTNEWEKKSDLYFGFRELPEISQGMVCFIENTVITDVLVDNYLKNDCFKDVIQTTPDKSTITITIPLAGMVNGIRKLNNLKPQSDQQESESQDTFYWLRETWIGIATNKKLKKADKLVMKIPVSLKHNAFPWTKRFLTMEVKEAELNEQNQTSTNDKEFSEE